MTRRALVVVAVLTAACGGGGSDEGPTAASHVGWSFQLQNGSSADCARAGVGVIVAVADEGPDVQSIPSPIDCILYEADTQQLPLGSYMVKLEAYNTIGGFIMSSPNFASELVEEGTYVPIAPHVFEVRF